MSGKEIIEGIIRNPDNGVIGGFEFKSNIQNNIFTLELLDTKRNAIVCRSASVVEKNHELNCYNEILKILLIHGLQAIK